MIRAANVANPLNDLAEVGQSIWLDHIRRSLITSGELQRLIDNDGLLGITSNRATFEKAIAGSTDYSDLLAGLHTSRFDAKATYELLAMRDIQNAADLLQSRYHASACRDGYASLDLSPPLARDTNGTLAEARRLWQAVARDNVMIKIPATPEGIVAFEELIAEAINVHVTLVFSQRIYTCVARAYIRGMLRLARIRGPVERVASVVSFCVSWIDTAANALIAACLRGEAHRQAELLQCVFGKVAIANAKLAYQGYLELFGESQWRALATKGAQTQRLLWASTEAKNHCDLVYIEELIGPDTLITMPAATLAAFRDHGVVRPRLTEGIDAARATMDTLARVGISIDAIGEQLLNQGLSLGGQSFDKLLNEVDIRRIALQQSTSHRRN